MGNKKNITLMTFNTLGLPFLSKNISGRYKKTAELITKAQPDIVCLQELFFYRNYFLFRNNLPDYPYAVFQKYMVGPRGGLVIFSKLPIEKAAFVPFTYPAGARTPWYTRGAGNGVLVAKLKDHPLLIATTHLTSDAVHNLEPKHTYYKIIRSQSEEVAQVFNNFSKQENLILTGDFNIAKDSELYNNFMKTTHAQDAFPKDTKATFISKRLRYFYQSQVSSRIDYIFLKQKSKKFDIINSSHLYEKEVPLSDGTMSYLSDHVGLQITFSIF